MDMRFWNRVGVGVIALSLLLAACGSDDPSPEEARDNLCDDLDAMRTELTSLNGLTGQSSMEDVESARDNIDEAWDDVVSSANDVADSEIDQLEAAYTELQRSLANVDEDAPIADVVSALGTQISAVVTAWDAIWAGTACP
jgi:multidrug efflux pump subunit AcrA (membrane-fusion protein)